MEDIKLYSEIEHLIIAWNIDGTKTAGYLTREIMGLINQRKLYKEQQELLESAYYNFIYNPYYKAKSFPDFMSSQAGQLVVCPTMEEFVNRCKTDTEFSERWGLKIEERELSLEERKKLYEEQKNQIEQDMSPFGFIVDGLDNNSFVDADGDRWYADEYGDRSYMWEYV